MVSKPPLIKTSFKGADQQRRLTIAITGGTGFVGGYVIRAALDAGHKVRAMVRRPEQVRDFTHANLTWVKGGLGLADHELVSGADVLIHLAGLVKARRRQDFYNVNDHAVGKLAEAAQMAGVKRFLLISSLTAREPEISHYGGSKRAGERAVKKMFCGKIAIIRAPAVFGPGDKATKPFFDLLAKGILPVPGGRQWKARKISMVFAPDLAVDIVEAASEGKYDGVIISPASLPNIGWKDFAALCRDSFKRSIWVMPLPLILLYPVAAMTSLTARLFGIGHLTLDKLPEFLHVDWSTETLISNPTPTKQALQQTMAAYRAEG